MAKGKSNIDTVVVVEKSTAPIVSYLVIHPFQDADEYRTKSGEPTKYKVGQDVSHFDAQRLSIAIERGLVELSKK